MTSEQTFWLQTLLKVLRKNEGGAKNNIIGHRILYMCQVPGASLEPPNQLSCFVVPPQEEGWGYNVSHASQLR